MINTTVGHYKILRTLGQGGMGAVYAAQDLRLDRQVALKILPPELAENHRLVDRFELEARAVAALDHPNIVTVYSVEEADGFHFITMQLVEGVPLKQVISPGGLPVKKLFTLALPLVDAIVAAHARGIIHRDIKPTNVMVGADDNVVVLDFGLAKLTEPNPGDDDPTRLAAQELTRTGVVLGTVTYMSPEQLRGKVVDKRTDIFSLGVVLYEMSIGQRPFRGESVADVMSSILRDEPSRVTEVRSDLPNQLGGIVGRCLESKPEDRYQTVEDLRADLLRLQDEVQEGSATTGERAAFGEPAWRPRRRSLVWGAAAALALLTGTLGFFILRSVTFTETTSDDGAVVAKDAGDQRQLVVVLPMENLGPSEQEYFAAGITDEITSRLASVSGLRVISRTSAMQYRDRRASIQEIGEQLGVDYVLEGTVRWGTGSSANRVRVTPKLVRVVDDVQVWAESIDFVLDDIFQVQSEIARKVIDQLGATLLEPEREGLDSRPTDSVDAYAAYLRGRYHAWLQDYTDDNWRLAVEAFEDAVTLDPDFAHAHAELAMAHSTVYLLRIDRSEARKMAARQAIERAADLAPDDPKVHLALGWHHYMVENDYEAALSELALAEIGQPENPEILMTRAFVLRRQGRWDEALDSLEGALRLNPRDSVLAGELAETFETLRRYDDAIRYWDLSIAVDPVQVYPYHSKARTLWLAEGTTDRSRAVLESMPATQDADAVITWFWQEMYERDYAAALERLSTAGETLEYWGGVQPRSLLEARALELLNKPERARQAYDAARLLLEQQVQQNSWDPRRHVSLGLAYAGLGRGRDAIRVTRRALELYPIADDSYSGPMYEIELALVFSLAGEEEAALEQLDYVLSIPSTLSVKRIELDPGWDSLRQSPSFSDLLDRYR